MNGLEITVTLGAAVFAGTVLAPRLQMATPLLLLLLGLALGFVPELRHIELHPEMVLLIFLPVMLFWESLTTSLRSIRRDFRGIMIMSTLLVVATAFGVAGIAHALGIPWAAALVLGAAVAPPDATAVAALGRTLPHRNFMLLKAEPEDTGLDDELRLAERALTTTTVTAIGDLADEHGISDEVRDRVSRDYVEHLALMDASRSERGAT